MKFKVTHVDVWAATIDDRPGGLAEKLELLVRAGANLEFVIARRTPERAGQGVVFVTPLKGARQNQAAADAGFLKTDTLHSVRIEGADKPGMGALMTRALASAGVNLRGLSAAAIGRRFVGHIALDSDQDAHRAMQVLKQVK